MMRIPKPEEIPSERLTECKINDHEHICRVSVQWLRITIVLTTHPVIQLTSVIFVTKAKTKKSHTTSVKV